MAESRGTDPQWIETGIPHLDHVLGGGLQRGSLAMVIGEPGAGKTVMAQQIAFHRAAAGQATVFLTGYSETHDKLLSHSHGLTFFRREMVGDKVQFVSLLDLLREGTDETLEAIVATARGQGASFVVIDGFGGMRRLLADDQAIAEFLYTLGARLALLGMTTLLCVEGDPNDAARYPEITVCDVILTLRQEHRGGQQRRLLHVMKARGSSPVGGLHPYVIRQDGLTVFPRFESTVLASEPEWAPGRAAFGITSLDRLLGGGLTAGTCTLLAGSPGMGKTTLGLHFTVEGAAVGEPTLFLGFLESPAQLREQAKGFGLDLAAAEATGQARLLVLPGHDVEADAVASLIAEDVDRRATRRLVIDSTAELERAIGDSERKAGYLSALVSDLRARRVTSLFTLDIPSVAGPSLDFADTPLWVLGENLLLMRNVEYRAELHRVFSVLKMRFSDHERAIYEFALRPGEGVSITAPAPLVEGLLTGVARPLAGERAQHEPPAR